MNIHLLSLSKRKILLSLFLPLLLFTAESYGQSTCSVNNANVCTGGNITENFNATSGAFTSTSLAYNGGAGRWELNNPNRQTTYTITSGNYRLAANGIAQVGFSFARIRGLCTINGSFNIQVVSNTTNMVLAQCNNLFFSGATTTVCTTIGDADLIANTSVHYVISFRTPFFCPNSAFAFDNFSVGASAIVIPIPVTLTSFTAKRESNSINLQWQTASEFNNRGFEIERKMEDDEDFRTIGFIAAKNANGNSNDILNYSYSDINISAGVSQYRLKQVDFDKKAKVSDVLLVRGTAASGRVLIYPNPSQQGIVNILFDSYGKRNMQLTDINGGLQQKWEGYSSGQLQLKSLRPGIYLLNVNDLTTDTKFVKKIIVLK